MAKNKSVNKNENLIIYGASLGAAFGAAAGSIFESIDIGLGISIGIALGVSAALVFGKNIIQLFGSANKTDLNEE